MQKLFLILMLLISMSVQAGIKCKVQGQVSKKSSKEYDEPIDRIKRGALFKSVQSLSGKLKSCSTIPGETVTHLFQFENGSTLENKRMTGEISTDSTEVVLAKSIDYSKARQIMEEDAKKVDHDCELKWDSSCSREKTKSGGNTIQCFCEGTNFSVTIEKEASGEVKKLSESFVD